MEKYRTFRYWAKGKERHVLIPCRIINSASLNLIPPIDFSDSNPFSPRETEIVTLLSQGRSNEIALELGLSPKTVDFYFGLLRNKFNLKSDTPKPYVKRLCHLYAKWKKDTEEGKNPDAVVQNIWLNEDEASEITKKVDFAKVRLYQKQYQLLYEAVRASDVSEIANHLGLHRSTIHKHYRILKKEFAKVNYHIRDFFNLKLTAEMIFRLGLLPERKERWSRNIDFHTLKIEPPLPLTSLNFTGRTGEIFSAVKSVPSLTQISDTLGISKSAASTHVTRLLRKMGIRVGHESFDVLKRIARISEMAQAKGERSISSLHLTPEEKSNIVRILGGRKIYIPKEMFDVVILIAQGMSSVEMAIATGKKEKTMRIIRGFIVRKLQNANLEVPTRIEVQTTVQFLLSNGYIEVESPKKASRRIYPQSLQIQPGLDLGQYSFPPVMGLVFDNSKSSGSLGELAGKMGKSVNSVLLNVSDVLERMDFPRMGTKEITNFELVRRLSQLKELHHKTPVSSLGLSGKETDDAVKTLKGRIIPLRKELFSLVSLVAQGQTVDQMIENLGLSRQEINKGRAEAKEIYRQAGLSVFSNLDLRLYSCFLLENYYVQLQGETRTIFRYAVDFLRSKNSILN